MLVPSVNTARCTKGSEGSSDLRNYQCWRSSFKSWLTCCVFSEIYPWPILFIYYLLLWIYLAVLGLTCSTQGVLVQFSRSLSDSLWHHGLQHTGLPCPSPTPRACSDSCPLSRWCHPTILSSVVPFSCLQSFPASGSSPIFPRIMKQSLKESLLDI